MRCTFPPSRRSDAAIGSCGVDEDARGVRSMGAAVELVESELRRAVHEHPRV